jgi:S1-C subfamily serine protease
MGLSESIAQGIVSAIYSDYVQFDAPISSGNSGGPLLDVHGNVVGIVTMISRSHDNVIVQNLNLAIPVAAIPLHRPPKNP